MKNHLAQLILLSLCLFSCQQEVQPPMEIQLPVAEPSPYVQVQSNLFEPQEFSGFLYLFEQGTSIPNEMISRHTMIANPYGSFYGVAAYSYTGGIKALILRQSTDMCQRHFMMTTDGNQILHQTLISEKCMPAPGASMNEYSTYTYEENVGIVRIFLKESFQPESGKEIVQRKAYQVNSRGEILVFTN